MLPLCPVHCVEATIKCNFKIQNGRQRPWLAGWLVAGGWLRLVAVDGSALALSISGQHSHLPAQTFRPQLDYGLLQLFTTLHFIRLGWICGQTINEE